MFSSVSPNLKICIEDEDTKNKLQTINIIFNCTDKCFYNDIKIDWESDSCIENCGESGNKYEHNNFCNGICPNTTFSSRNNEYLYLDKSSEGIYYFDSTKNLYKEYYNTCKKCNEWGDK